MARYAGGGKNTVEGCRSIEPGTVHDAFAGQDELRYDVFTPQ
jgi:hypothetical protein